MQNKFFGSKLNTVLLFILIILMVIALVMMSKNKEMYLSGFKQLDQNTEIVKKQNPDQISSEILGNKDDLVSFSIKPGQQVSGKMEVTGSIKGAYFFEGNLPVKILDSNKQPTIYGPGHGQASTEWMTAGPVSFSFDIDFSLIPKGLAYIQIRQDDPRDESEKGGYKVKEILIPIIIN